MARTPGISSTDRSPAIGGHRRIDPAGWLRRRILRLARAVRPPYRPVADDRPTATFVGNNRVLVGTKVGHWTMAYYVEADDRLLSPWFIVTGRYEDALTAYFLRTLKPDSHCLDIGANFGFFTCLMARYCPAGKVLGVEADGRLADLARDNLSSTGFMELRTPSARRRATMAMD